MAALTSSLLLPSELKPSLLPQHQPLQSSVLLRRTRRRPPMKHQSTVVPVARLFGPAIFEASKPKVLFLGVDEMKHAGKLPRTYLEQPKIYLAHEQKAQEP